MMANLVCSRKGCQFVCNNRRDWEEHADRVHTVWVDDEEKCANPRCRALRATGSKTCTMTCRIHDMQHKLDALNRAVASPLSHDRN